MQERPDERASRRGYSDIRLRTKNSDRHAVTGPPHPAATMTDRGRYGIYS